MGGDELNIPEAGKNYGWPVVSWGSIMMVRQIPEPPTHPEFADAIYHWNPVISPSGMTFYTADVIPDWKGNLLIGGLVLAGDRAPHARRREGHGGGADSHGRPHPRRGARPRTARSTP